MLIHMKKICFIGTSRQKMYFSVADDSVALFFSVMGSTAWKIYSNRAVIIVEVTFDFVRCS